MENVNNNVENNETNYLTSIIEVITVWRRFIFSCIILSVILSAIVAFLITPQFKSTASVLPADQADLFGSIDGISSIAKAFAPAKGFAALRGGADLDRYVAILHSGRVLSKVIAEFDLVKVYKITSYPGEKSAKELLANVEFTVENEGYLSVVVYDEDPIRAAAMANYFIDELNRTNSELQAQNAKANRQFIEERYKKNLHDLSSAEDSLKVFQKKYGVISMPEQTTMSIKAGAEIIAQLSLKEIQLNIEQRLQSNDNPSVNALRVEIDEYKKKISAMNKSTMNDHSDMNLLVPFANIPDLGSEFVRRMREVEIQYKILQFLTPLFEQSKVEEKRQTPSVIVLDRAYPAERKSRPKRLFIILGGLIVGVFFSISYVGVRIRWENEKKQDSNFYKVASRFLSEVSSDIKSLKLRRYKKIPEKN